MKNVGEMWVPDHERHLIQWAKDSGDLLHYQRNKLDSALKWVKNRGVAVDVGAHCGLWSVNLVKLFNEVYAFEPVKEHQACFKRNVPEAKLYPVALGEKAGRCSMQTERGCSGRTHVTDGGRVRMQRLDDFDLRNVDFLKIDTEGYEWFVLKGAVELLKSKPCVIVEQKQGLAKRYGLHETKAVAFLVKLGAEVRDIISGDYILSWPN